jgi:hypothetical protein
MGVVPDDFAHGFLKGLLAERALDGPAPKYPDEKAVIHFGFFWSPKSLSYNLYHAIPPWLARKIITTRKARARRIQKISTMTSFMPLGYSRIAAISWMS